MKQLCAIRSRGRAIWPLGLRFSPLRPLRPLQHLGHRNGCLHDALVTYAGFQVLYEGAVDFQRTHRESRQAGQRQLTPSEFIDRHVEASILQSRQDSQDALRIFDRAAFRYFQLVRRVRQPALVQRHVAACPGWIASATEKPGLPAKPRARVAMANSSVLNSVD